ncbi:hypothetical protein AAMO2058_000017300 [Amorphochlora amoebiformis]
MGANTAKEKKTDVLKRRASKMDALISAHKTSRESSAAINVGTRIPQKDLPDKAMSLSKATIPPQQRTPELKERPASSSMKGIQGLSTTAHPHLRKQQCEPPRKKYVTNDAIAQDEPDQDVKVLEETVDATINGLPALPNVDEELTVRPWRVEKPKDSITTCQTCQTCIVS